MHIVSIIHNTKLNRWHPVYFRLSPQPSSDPTDVGQRFNSGGHHTEGFSTRDTAIEYAKTLADKISQTYLGSSILSLEQDFPWDGEGVPAMVVFFAVEGEKAKPLF